jgi:hypothetical protein
LVERPVDIFNANASSEEARRILAYLEATGSDVVATVHSRINGETPEQRRAREDREFSASIGRVIATQERIEQFHIEIRELEKRRTDLLAKIDERLRIAEEKLQRLRDEAPTVEFPDGSRRKVFRDHDKVRDEFGGLVSPDIIKAEAVSKDTRNWEKNRTFAKDVESLSDIRRDLEKAGNDMKGDLERADKHELSNNDMDKRRRKFEDDLAKAEKALGQYDAGVNVTNKERTFGTLLNPTLAFDKVRATEEAPLPTQPEPFKPPQPAASAPAPK